MEIYAFILLSLLAIATSIGTVLNRSAVNSALFMVLHLLTLAGLYLLLRAQFLAIIQVIVYAGAIMVLFLFVIMLLNVEEEENIIKNTRFGFIGAFMVGALLLGQVVYSLLGLAGFLPELSGQAEAIGTVEAIGDVMFTDYLLPLQVTAILLTSAVVGAMMIAEFTHADGTPQDLIEHAPEDRVEEGGA